MSQDSSHGDPPSVNEEVAKLRLQLREYSLTRLEEDGIVRWERERIISYGKAHTSMRNDLGGRRSDE